MDFRYGKKFFKKMREERPASCKQQGRGEGSSGDGIWSLGPYTLVWSPSFLTNYKTVAEKLTF